MDPGNGAFVRSVARTHLSSLMSSLDEAASGGTITRMESQEMKKSAIEAYRAKFSRSGAKAKMAYGDISDTDNKIRHLLGEAKSAYRHVLMPEERDRIVREYLSQIPGLIRGNTERKLIDEFLSLARSVKFSRPGAKANGLNLAQRIAVAHDAKRMALR